MPLCTDISINYKFVDWWFEVYTSVYTVRNYSKIMEQSVNYGILARNDAHLYNDPKDVNIAPLLDSKFDLKNAKFSNILTLIAEVLNVSKFFPQMKLQHHLEH